MRNLRTLETEGMVNSKNDYQEVINAIAKVCNPVLSLNVHEFHVYSTDKKKVAKLGYMKVSDCFRKIVNHGLIPTATTQFTFSNYCILQCLQ